VNHFGASHAQAVDMEDVSKLNHARSRGVFPLMPTEEMLATVLRTSEGVSDLFFSPMRPPEVGSSGRFSPASLPGTPVLVPEDTTRIAHDLIGNRPALLARLRDQGSCVFSFFLANLGRFRVHIFSQRGTYAIALHVIPDVVPNFPSLGLPPQLKRLVEQPSGLVLIAGPAGSGKSSTLAAFANQINEERTTPIVTIEDPIEFLHRHKQATVLQRELYRDVPSFPAALQSSSRLPPHVIFLSDLADRETADLLLDVVDGGNLVFAGFPAPDVHRTVERFLRFFSPLEENTTRTRLGRCLTAIVAQKSVSPAQGSARTRLFEILFSTPRIRECLTKGESGVMSLETAIEEGASQGMQSFRMELAKHSSAQDFGVQPALEGRTFRPLPRTSPAKHNADTSPRHMGARLTPASRTF
jgi:twitching motility protein PilT